MVFKEMEIYSSSDVHIATPSPDVLRVSGDADHWRGDAVQISHKLRTHSEWILGNCCPIEEPNHAIRMLLLKHIPDFNYDDRNQSKSYHMTCWMVTKEPSAAVFSRPTT